MYVHTSARENQLLSTRTRGKKPLKSDSLIPRRVKGQSVLENPTRKQSTQRGGFDQIY